jgi:hypothetical protein
VVYFKYYGLENPRKITKNLRRYSPYSDRDPSGTCRINMHIICVNTPSSSVITMIYIYLRLICCSSQHWPIVLFANNFLVVIYTWNALCSFFVKVDIQKILNINVKKSNWAYHILALCGFMDVE